MALYDSIGCGYAALRRPDQRIASAIDAALGGAESVVNIGAGAGSYEPPGRTVLAVEPSEVMIRQRPAGAAPCLRGSAEALPLETDAVDAAMAILSAHHWTDLERGFGEMARVARKRAVLLTWVPDAAPFWLTEDYFPEIAAHDRTIFPDSAALTAMLARRIGPVRMTPVPIPHDCTDGFLCAYWRRPELYLSAERRSAISSFARIDAEAGLAKLRDDLSSGRWAERHRALLALDTLDVGYRLVCCEIRQNGDILLPVKGGKFMSSESYICLKSNGRRANAPEGMEGYAAVLPWAQEHLDTVARELGVTPPSDFVRADRARIAGMLDGKVSADLAARLDRQTEWHPASAGHATFAALLRHIDAQPALVHKLIGEHNDLESVRITVDVMRQILDAATRRGDSFRIEHNY